MDLKQLEYFLESVRLGSFTRAAEELYTTQPHVSLVVKSLEQELGVRLLRRESDGLKLTEAGESIYFYAENVFKNTDMIREISKELKEKCLRFAANPSSSLAFLAGDFMERHMEDMTLQYTECRIEEMMRLLLERRYDIGLLFVPVSKMHVFSHMLERKHLHYTPLCVSDLVVHSGNGSPFYGRTEISPEELDACACIQFEDDFFSVADLLYEKPPFRNGKCTLRKVIRTNSDHIMIRMLQTTPLCNIGSYWTREMYGKYNFSMTRIKGFENAVSFGYMHPEHQVPSGETEEFLAMIREKTESRA